MCCTKVSELSLACEWGVPKPTIKVFVSTDSLCRTVGELVMEGCVTELAFTRGTI